MMNTEDALQNLKKYSFKPADLLKLDNFLAPTLILIFYWIAMVVVVIVCLVQIVAGLALMAHNFVGGLGLFFLSLISLVLSPLLVRLVFEQMIVLFKIHEHLRHIRDAGDKSAG